ncbi:MAG: hypothetical protein C0467_17905 [Planctomycetaceae bacterium]|nr:hypothetical protein [Planctomycetaceae bacterium]
MRRTETCMAWVVYRMTLPKQAIGGNVVCEQTEWDALELARPGYHVLLHSGLKTEQEAEKLARGTAGDPPIRGAKKAAMTPPAMVTNPMPAPLS